MVNLQYVIYDKLDKKKWDACINSASNGLIYACSGYLDGMALKWDAIVLNDYEMVMPLPCRKKFGINYIFQPSITPALGIFGNSITPEITSDFLKVIPQKFKVWDVSFNNSNKVLFNKGVIVARSNYILQLSRNYDEIRRNYSANVYRNIEAAIKNKCVLKKDISFDEVSAVCKAEFPKFTKVENGLFEKLYTVYETYKADSAIYGVFSKAGTLLASCIFLFFKGRAYYWLVGNTPESRQYGASSFLIDCFIQEYAGRNLILDFEGSDTKSVADFYKKFGATLEEYSTLYLNKLPFPFNLLKPVPHQYRSLILQ